MMIENVTFERTTYAAPPHKFEAGTGHIAGAVGLGAAVDYLSGVDLAAARSHEEALMRQATEGLSAIPGLRILGTAPGKVSVVTFAIDGVDSEQVGRTLDGDGIAARAGHHCAQPALAHFGLKSAVRASFAFYNTHREVERLVDSVRRSIAA